MLLFFNLLPNLGNGEEYIYHIMNDLKKVQFSLSDVEYGYYDLTKEERSEEEALHMQQMGLFHLWGTEIVVDGESGTMLSKTVAIVEDAKGQIHKVDPELIRFIK
jgi:hypothetical protein